MISQKFFWRVSPLLYSVALCMSISSLGNIIINFSINVLSFYHEYHSLIGNATHYLLYDR